MKRIVACLTLVVAAAVPVSQGAIASQGGPAQISRTRGVDISHFEFHPHTLAVAKGTKVVFSNSSGTTHTATGSGFDTGRIKPGHAAAVSFEQKGTFSYHCKIHPFMHGKVVVG
jgi:plastocyanin